jgi:hypothetical protein
MNYLIPDLPVFRVLKILHRKYFRKISRKFPGKFFVQRSHAKGELQEGPTLEKRPGGATQEWGCATHAHWAYRGS